jgi:hypothetical protein
MDEQTPSDELTPERKERLRAAMRILVEYLLKNGHLTQFRHSTNLRNEHNPVVNGDTLMQQNNSSLLQ